MQAKVSLITTCYNGEQYIENYIHNVLSQTYELVEVIFINDGSTDKTEEMILNYSYKIEDKKYTFIYVKQENKGVSGAINSALKLFTGDYIMLLDMDDILYPDAIKEKTDFLSSNLDYGMVRNNGYYVFEEYPRRKWKFEKTNRYCYKDNIFEDLLLVKTNNWPGSYMIRSEALLKIYPERDIYISRYGQNLQLMLPVAYYFKTGFINKCLMEYYIHNGSLSHSNKPERMHEMVNGYENIRVEIVKQLNISNKEKDLYLMLVEKKYIKDRLCFSLCINNRELFEQQFLLLNKNGWATITEKIQKLLYKNNIFSFMYRVYHHLIFLFRKSVI